MARLGRVVIPEMPRHVIQRANRPCIDSTWARRRSVTFTRPPKSAVFSRNTDRVSADYVVLGLMVTERSLRS